MRAPYIYGEGYHNYVGASTSVQFTRDLSLQIKMEVIFHELFFIEVSLSLQRLQEKLINVPSVKLGSTAQTEGKS